MYTYLQRGNSIEKKMQKGAFVETDGVWSTRFDDDSCVSKGVKDERMMGMI